MILTLDEFLWFVSLFGAQASGLLVCMGFISLCGFFWCRLTGSKQVTGFCLWLAVCLFYGSCTV